jgi:integrase
MPSLGDMKRNRSNQRSKPETVKVGNVAVKLYKRERETVTGDTRTVYEVSDYTNGIRRLRGFTDHSAALKEAERIARQLSSGDAVAAMMKNSEAASYGRSVELLRPTGTALEFATGIYAKAYAIVGDRIIEAAQFFKQHNADDIVPRKVADVVAEFIELKRARNSSRRYVNDLNARLARFAESFAVDVSAVTTADVQNWLDRLKLSPRSIKNFRGSLSTLFAFAELRGYIAKGCNPVSDTEKLNGNGDCKIEIFTPKELAKLLNHAPKAFVPYLAIGAFAGLRSAEIERLEWKDVDVAGGFIHIAAAKAKTRSRRLVPISSNLAQWFAGFAKKSGNVWTGNERDLLDARAETVKASGVAWKDNSLRHSFISYRLAEIQDAAQVALEAGNSPNMVFKHYREIVKPDVAKAWFAIRPDAPANI